MTNHTTTRPALTRPPAGANPTSKSDHRHQDRKRTSLKSARRAALNRKRDDARPAGGALVRASGGLPSPAKPHMAEASASRGRPFTFARFHQLTPHVGEPERAALFFALPEQMQRECWLDLEAACAVWGRRELCSR